MSKSNYYKKYYETNRLKHLDYCKQKVKCKDCGGLYTRSNVTKHRKTKKHQLGEIIQNEKYHDMKKKYQMTGSGSKTSKTVSLTRINKSEKLIQEHINDLKQKGRIEISKKKQLESFPLGSYISYVTKDNKYRSGGFLKLIGDKYFVLQGGTKGNPISFSVQFNNIKTMYVKNPYAQQENNE